MKILYQDRSDHLLALSRFALLNIVYYVYIILTMDAVLFFFTDILSILLYELSLIQFIYIF